MSARRKFRIGLRVRPSSYGISSNIFSKTRHKQSGVVTKVDEFNDPTVLWDGRKTPKRYYYGFVALDRRTPLDGDGDGDKLS